MDTGHPFRLGTHPAARTHLARPPRQAWRGSYRGDSPAQTEPLEDSTSLGLARLSALEEVRPHTGLLLGPLKQ